MIAAKHKIRVLIVDDSALVRKILCVGLSKDPDIEVIGQASDPYRARDLLVELEPDVVTLDVEMPRMDGVTFLRRFMPVMPVPTVVISSLTQKGRQITLDALEAGAVDVIAKPMAGVADGLPIMLDDICRRVKSAAAVNMAGFVRTDTTPTEEVTAALGETTDRVIAIGASTGGVQALSRILPAFPPDAPGIVIVQHMPTGFTSTFAERLNSCCRMRVSEAEDGSRVLPGSILLAPGGTRHMSLTRYGGEYRVTLKEGPPVNYSRPAVDVLFHSVAREAKGNAAAAVLTGMGKDGASGLLAIRQAGGHTFAQDEASCVVFGMPQAARELGAAERMLPLEKIPTQLVGALHR
ncbi:MAG: chemotaxis response regulator protein-glutamate methylesterase [Burkholderiaceae bacterium]|nr:chemotaxis response regulator protein-glutamate methylesterase [Burkholderiaceae bacterium]